MYLDFSVINGIGIERDGNRAPSGCVPAGFDLLAEALILSVSGLFLEGMFFLGRPRHAPYVMSGNH